MFGESRGEENKNSQKKKKDALKFLHRLQIPDQKGVITDCSATHHSYHLPGFSQSQCFIFSFFPSRVYYLLSPSFKATDGSPL